ncbi:MAG: hypothetical protein N2554_01865, partial [Fimbriimonadales bacterium]|nr:hypothetical protein [Fimbriimonadales bacterium]
MRAIVEWLCRCIAGADVTNLVQLAPQLLSNPLLATGVGGFILLMLGWNAYQQYQEALQSRKLERIEGNLRRLYQEYFTLREAAQELRIDPATGRVDFGLLTEQERNNPHILLFKLLTERVDNVEAHLDALLQSLPDALQGRLALLISEQAEQLLAILRQQDQQLAESLRAELQQTHQVALDYLKRIEARLVEQGYPPLYIPSCSDEQELSLIHI